MILTFFLTQPPSLISLAIMENRNSCILNFYSCFVFYNTNQNQHRKMLYEFVFMTFIVIVNTSINYILNGDFENPLILQNQLIISNCVEWTGIYDLKGPYFSLYNLGHNQFIDLQTEIGINGYIQQDVIIPKNGSYNLSYLQLAPSSMYTSYMMEIYWNGALLQTKIANSTSVTQQFIIIEVVSGLNTLKLVEIGNSSDYQGMQIDHLSLVYMEPSIVGNTTGNATNTNTTANTTNTNNTTNSTNITVNPTNNTSTTANTTNTNSTVNSTNNANSTELQNSTSITNSTTIPIPTNQTNNTNIINTTKIVDETNTSKIESKDSESTLLNILSTVLSLPLNQLPSFKYLLFFVEDFWLYYHNPRSYSGIVDDIFKTIVTIENMKFKIIADMIDTESLIAKIPSSDYSEYTRPQFLEVETSDSVLFKVIFNFFVYTIPSNIIICFIFYQIFKAIHKYKISLLFRRYYFFWGALIQILFEGNVAYFTFCCFNHLGHSFSFRFADKLALIFTITFLFIILILSVTFYILVGRIYQKQASYFIYCLYRCEESYFFLVMYSMGFQFIRGCIHYFLMQHYGYLILSLCLLEVTIIIFIICMEKLYQIFIPKSMFSTYLAYHFCFILLNLSLYYQEILKKGQMDTSMILDAQKIVIFCIIIINGVMMLVDLIPLEYVKVKDTLMEELEDDEIQAIRIYQNQVVGKEIRYDNKPKKNS